MPPKKRKPPPASPPRGPKLELRGGPTTGAGAGGRRAGQQPQQHQQHQQQRATAFSDAHNRPIRTRGAPAPSSSSSSSSTGAAGGGDDYGWGGAGAGAGKRARTTGGATGGPMGGAGAGASSSSAYSSSSSSAGAVAPSRSGHGHHGHHGYGGHGYKQQHQHQHQHQQYHGGGGGGGRHGGGGPTHHTSFQLGSPAVAALRLVPLPDPVLHRLRAALPFQIRKGFPTRRLTGAPALLTAITDGLAHYLPQPSPPYTLPMAPGGPGAPACLHRPRGDGGGMQRDWLLVPSDLRTRWLLRRAAAGDEGEGEEGPALPVAEEEGELPLQLDLRRLLQPPGAPAPILLMPDPTLETGAGAMDADAVGPPAALRGWLEGEGAAALAAEAGVARREGQGEEEGAVEVHESSLLLPCPRTPGFPLRHAGFAPGALRRTVLGFASAAAAAGPQEEDGGRQQQAAVWGALMAAAYRGEEEEDAAALARLQGGPPALRCIDWEEVEEAAAGAKTKAGLLALEGTAALVGALLREAAATGGEGQHDQQEQEQQAEGGEGEDDGAGRMQRFCAMTAAPLPFAAVAFLLPARGDDGGAAASLAAWVLGADSGGDATGTAKGEHDGTAIDVEGAGGGSGQLRLLAGLAPDPGDDAVFPATVPRHAPIPEHAAPGPGIAPLLLGSSSAGAADEEEAEERLAAWGLQLVGAAGEGQQRTPLPARALGPVPSFVAGVRSGSGSSSGLGLAARPVSLLLVGGPRPPPAGNDDPTRRFLSLPPPPPSYPTPPAVRPSHAIALAALLPRLLALLGDAQAQQHQHRRQQQPFLAVLSTTAKAAPVPAAAPARPLHWRPGLPAPRPKPWEEAAAAGASTAGPLSDFFRLSDLDDSVGHDLALMLFFACDDPGLEAMTGWYEDRPAVVAAPVASPPRASSLEPRGGMMAAAEMEEAEGAPVASGSKRRGAVAVGAGGAGAGAPQLRVTVSGKARSTKGDSLAGVFASASALPPGTAAAAPGKQPQQKKRQQHVGGDHHHHHHDEDDLLLFAQPSPASASASSAASSPLAASPPPPRAPQARVVLQPVGAGAGAGTVTTVSSAGTAKGKGKNGGDARQGGSPGGGGGADALLDDFFQLRKPGPSARRGGGGGAGASRGPSAAPPGARPAVPASASGGERAGQGMPVAPGAAFAAATCVVAERLLDLGEDELIQGMAREFNVTLVDAPLDEDLDLLLDERTGVKLLGLDAVVEDPSTDPAFDSYKASIRRLLSLSTKLETLYLLLVPGGDPLQHRAAIRAISNAVLNCTRMEVVVRVVSEGDPGALRRLLRAAVDATLLRREGRKTASDDAWLQRAGASMELLDQAAFLATCPTLNFWAALLMIHQLPLRQLLAAPAASLRTAFPTLPAPWLHDFAALCARDLSRPAALRMAELLSQAGHDEEDEEDDNEAGGGWGYARGGGGGRGGGYDDPPLPGAEGSYVGMGMGMMGGSGALPPSPPRFTHGGREEGVGGGGGAWGGGGGAGSEWSVGGRTDFSPSPSPSPSLPPPPRAPSTSRQAQQQHQHQQRAPPGGGGFYSHQQQQQHQHYQQAPRRQPPQQQPQPPQPQGFGGRRGGREGYSFPPEQQQQHHHTQPQQQQQQQQQQPPPPPRHSYQQLGAGQRPPPHQQQQGRGPLPPPLGQRGGEGGGSRLKPARVGLDYTGAVVGGAGGQMRLRFLPK